MGTLILSQCIIFFIIELGEGWGPSMINSNDEFGLFETERFFFLGDVWIGGSTDQDADQAAVLGNYRNDSLGECTSK